MDNRPPSATGESSPSLLSSPKLASRLSSSGSVAPWQKYNPSPSHASPSAGILKRKSIDDSISSTEVRKVDLFLLEFRMGAAYRFAIVSLLFHMFLPPLSFESCVADSFILPDLEPHQRLGTDLHHLTLY